MWRRPSACRIESRLDTGCGCDTVPGQWGGQSGPQPPFRRLSRPWTNLRVRQRPAKSRLQPGLAAPQLAQDGRQNQKL